MYAVAKLKLNLTECCRVVGAFGFCFDYFAFDVSGLIGFGHAWLFVAQVFWYHKQILYVGF